MLVINVNIASFVSWFIQLLIITTWTKCDALNLNLVWQWLKIFCMSWWSFCLCNCIFLARNHPERHINLLLFLVPNPIRRRVFLFLLFLVYQSFVPTLTSQFWNYIAHPMETFPLFLHMAFNWIGFACIVFIFRFARLIRTPVHECYCDNNLSAIGCFDLFLNLRRTIDVFVSR